MNQKLLGSEETPKIHKTLLKSPIQRYNYFIDIYNLPSNLVDNTTLLKMG